MMFAGAPQNSVAQTTRNLPPTTNRQCKSCKSERTSLGDERQAAREAAMQRNATQKKTELEMMNDDRNFCIHYQNLYY